MKQMRTEDLSARSLKRTVWGWMFFDWASQPYFTLLLTFIFAPYFTSIVMSDPVLAQQYWGWMLAAVGISVAVLAPVLGSVADQSRSRQPWIVGFSVLYVAGAFSLWWAEPGSERVLWILLAFGIGMIGVEFATIFTNAMLPDLGRREDVGVISGSGWAFGYAGGLIALAIMLLFLAENERGVTFLGLAPAFGLDPGMHEGTRSVGPFTAVWYVLFMVPFFLWVRIKPSISASTSALSGLLKTLMELPKQKSLAAYLASSMLYRDALNGVFAFGGIYASGVLGWSIVQVGMFGIFGLVFGMAFAWLGGFADRRYGPKVVISVSILVLTAVCFVIVTTSPEMVLLVPVEENSELPHTVFFGCGCLIGAAGGTIQAASRTMMVRQANPERMTEAFGLYALAGKATAFLAPMLIAIMTSATDNQRLGVTPLIVLFLLGLILLRWVSSEEQAYRRQVK